jgi:predicted enzyme related to lactoylglutathione lyase
MKARDVASQEGRSAMPKTVVTPSPGFISIAVRDAKRSAGFYERYLGAMRDTFDFGPDSAVFVGWPTFALSSVRRPDLPPPSPETTSIQLWWRASDAQALYEQVVADGVPVLAEPFDGPFGRTFAMADPDGYRVTVYEKDQPLFWPPRRG